MILFRLIEASSKGSRYVTNPDKNGNRWVVDTRDKKPEGDGWNRVKNAQGGWTWRKKYEGKEKPAQGKSEPKKKPGVKSEEPAATKKDPKSYIGKTIRITSDEGPLTVKVMEVTKKKGKVIFYAEDDDSGYEFEEEDIITKQKPEKKKEEPPKEEKKKPAEQKKPEKKKEPEPEPEEEEEPSAADDEDMKPFDKEYGLELAIDAFKAFAKQKRIKPADLAKMKQRYIDAGVSKTPERTFLYDIADGADIFGFFKTHGGFEKGVTSEDIHEILKSAFSAVFGGDEDEEEPKKEKKKPAAVKDEEPAVDEKKKSNEPGRYITIKYDDGSTETLLFLGKKNKKGELTAHGIEVDKKGNVSSTTVSKIVPDDIVDYDADSPFSDDELEGLIDELSDLNLYDSRVLKDAAGKEYNAEERKQANEDEEEEAEDEYGATEDYWNDYWDDINSDALDGTGKFKCGDRVETTDGRIGYIRKTLKDGMYKVELNRMKTIEEHHESSLKLAPHKIMQSLAVGDKITSDGRELTVTSIGETLDGVEAPGMVFAMDEQAGGIGGIRPDMIDGSEHEINFDDKEVMELGKRAFDAVRDKEVFRRVLQSLSTAVKNGRNSTTIGELTEHLRTAFSQVYSDEDIENLMLGLAKQIPGLKFVKRSGIITLQSAGPGLNMFSMGAFGAEAGMFASTRDVNDSINMYGFKNQLDRDEVFAYDGMKVTFNEDVFYGKYDTETGQEEAVKAPSAIYRGIFNGVPLLQVEGMEKPIPLNMFWRNVPDMKKRKQDPNATKEQGLANHEFFQPTRGETGEASLATDGSGRRIVPDFTQHAVFAPAINTSNYWTLFDRRLSRDYAAGDRVRTLGGGLVDKNLRTRGGYKKSYVGEVIDVLKNGLVRTKLNDGRIIDISPRRLRLERTVESMQDIKNILSVDPRSVFSAAFSMLEDDVKLSFGGDELDGLTHDEDKGEAIPELTMIFKNRRAFNEHGSNFFTTVPLTSTTASTSKLVPNRDILDVLMNMYPGRDFISVVKDIDPKTREVHMRISLSKENPYSTTSVDIASAALLVTKKPEGYESDTWENKTRGVGTPIKVTTDGSRIYFSNNLNDYLITANLSLKERVKEKHGREYIEVEKSMSKNLYNFVTASETSLRISGVNDIERDYSRMFMYSADKGYSVNIQDMDKAMQAIQYLFGDTVVNRLLETVDGAYFSQYGKGGIAAHKKEMNKKFAAVIESKANEKLEPIKGFKVLKNGKAVDGTKELFGFQKQTVNFMAGEQRKILLANDQGTGKTPSILATVLKRMQQGEVKQTLVVCPAPIQGNWMREIAAWTGKDKSEVADAEMAISIGDVGNIDKRKAIYDDIQRGEGPAITLISYNTLANDWDIIAKLGFDMVVLDEAQKIKNMESKTGGKIKVTFDDVPYKIASSGTPIENNPEELFSVMEFLDPGALGDIKQFNRDFLEVASVEQRDVTTGQVKGYRERVVGVRNLNLLGQKLTPMIVRYTKNDIAESLKKERGFDVIGNRNVYPRPELNMEKGELTFDESQIIHRNDSAAEQKKFWEVHDSIKHAAIRYATDDQSGKFNPFEVFAALQMLTDDPRLIKDEYLKKYGLSDGEIAEIKKSAEELDAQDANGNFIHHHPKRDTMLEKMRTHFSTPRRAKMLIFTQYREMIPRIQKWILMDKQLRKMMGISDAVAKKAIETNDFESVPQLLDFMGGQAAVKQKDVGKMAKAIEDMMDGKEVDEEDDLSPAERKKLMATREAKQRLFQTDSHASKVMICTDAAQTGLTLTAANTVINFDIPWNPKAMDQRIDRAHRLSPEKGERAAKDPKAQSLDVDVFNLVMDGSVDMAKMQAHAEKENVFQEVIQSAANMSGQMITKLKTTRLSNHDSPEYIFEVLLKDAKNVTEEERQKRLEKIRDVAEKRKKKKKGGEE